MNQFCSRMRFIALQKSHTSPRPHRYNQRALSLDFLELLERFIPTEYEMKLIRNYEREGRPLDELSEEDRFMVRFSQIPRLSQRISTLTFMGNFPESVQLVQPVSPAEGSNANVYLRQEVVDYHCSETNNLNSFICFWQQLNALIAASMSIKSSSKLKKILEVSPVMSTSPRL